MPDGVSVSSVLNDQKLTLQFNQRAQFRPGGCEGGGAAEHRLDQPAGRRQLLRGRHRADRRGRRAFLPRGKELCDRCRLPAGGKARACAAKPQAAAKPAVPARPGPAPRISRDKTLKESPPPQQPAEIPPVTSEMIAEQARIEIKPAQVIEAPAVAAAAPPAVETGRRPRTMRLLRPRRWQPAPEKTAPAAEKTAPAAEKTSPPTKAAQPAERVQAAAAEAPKAEAPKMAPAPGEPPKQAAAASSSPPPESGAKDKPAAVEARRDSDGLRVTFSFAAPTPAALFRRADTVWLVFDHANPIDIEPIRAKGGAVIGDVSRLPLEKGQAIRLRLNDRNPSLESEGRADEPSWTLTFADRGHDAAAADRAAEHYRSRARQCHRAAGQSRCDAPAGRSRRRRYAVGRHRAASDPRSSQAAGFRRTIVLEIRSRRGRAPELRRYQRRGRRRQGDAWTARRIDAVVADVAAERATAAVRPLFDANEWRKNQEEKFLARLDALINAAAAAGPEQKAQTRLELANFYMSREMYQEARE